MLHRRFFANRRPYSAIDSEKSCELVASFSTDEPSIYFRLKDKRRLPTASLSVMKNAFCPCLSIITAASGSSR